MSAAAVAARAFVLHPVRFFEARLPERPGWRWSAVAVTLWMLLLFLGFVIRFEKATGPVSPWELPGRAAQEWLVLTIAGLSTMMTGLSTYGVALIVLASAGVLLRDDVAVMRLAGWTGVAFVSQLPYRLAALASALAWHPSSQQSGMPATLTQYGLAVDSLEQQMVRAVGYLSASWTILICFAALKAATGASHRAIAIGAATLGVSMIGVYKAAIWLGGIGQ